MKISLKKCVSFAILLTISFITSAQSPKLSGKYLLVIDMQENGTKYTLEPAHAKSLLEKVNMVISKADTDKVLYVEAIMARLGISLTKLTVDFEPGMALDDRLTLVGNTRIVKTEANSFSAEQLQHFIKETGASDFVIVGLMAEHCIRATALGGIQEGYSMSVIPEAIAAESEQSKAETMSELQKAGVNILSLEEL